MGRRDANELWRSQPHLELKLMTELGERIAMVEGRLDALAQHHERTSRFWTTLASVRARAT